jgi:hypothetical protein
MPLFFIYLENNVFIAGFGLFSKYGDRVGRKYTKIQVHIINEARSCLNSCTRTFSLLILFGVNVLRFITFCEIYDTKKILQN